MRPHNLDPHVVVNLVADLLFLSFLVGLITFDGVKTFQFFPLNWFHT